MPLDRYVFILVCVVVAAGVTVAAAVHFGGLVQGSGALPAVIPVALMIAWGLVRLLGRRSGTPHDRTGHR